MNLKLALCNILLCTSIMMKASVKSGPTESLVQAADLGDISGMEKAMAAGADINKISLFQVKNAYGMMIGTNALGAALNKRQQKAINFLIDHKANVNTLTGVPLGINYIKNASPLMLAIANNLPESVERFIKAGVDVNYKDKENGITALLLALSRNEDLTSFITLLLENKADIHDVLQAPDWMARGNPKNMQLVQAAHFLSQEQLKAKPGPSEVELKTTAQFPGLQKVNDERYVGIINDKFYLAMEKVTPQNINVWLTFARQQETLANTNPVKNFSTEGIDYFYDILERFENTIKSPDELWIAYASTEPKKETHFINYFAIEMFVTVISSPEALLTTHLGISRSHVAAREIEAGTRLKQPDQSMQLHSFAAKVMLNRNPQRIYMITFPAQAMRAIFSNKLPVNAVFVGDNIYKTELAKAQQNPQLLLTPDEIEKKKDEDSATWQKRINKIAQARLSDYLQILKRNPPRIERTRACDNDYCQNLSFSIQTPRGQQLFFNRDTKIYQWLFTDMFETSYIQSPYTLIDLHALANWSKLKTE